MVEQSRFKKYASRTLNGCIAAAVVGAGFILYSLRDFIPSYPTESELLAETKLETSLERSLEDIYGVEFLFTPGANRDSLVARFDSLVSHGSDLLSDQLDAVSYIRLPQEELSVGITFNDYIELNALNSSHLHHEVSHVHYGFLSDKQSFDTAWDAFSSGKYLGGASSNATDAQRSLLGAPSKYATYSAKENIGEHVELAYSIVHGAPELISFPGGVKLADTEFELLDDNKEIYLRRFNLLTQEGFVSEQEYSQIERFLSTYL